MQEELLFDRIHDALDIEPPAGAYERLRIVLTQKPVKPQSWPAFQTRWSKMSFRLVAGVALVALAAAILAAIFALHSASNNQVPGGSGMSIPAYQKMVADDNANAHATYSAPCDSTNPTGCITDATRGIPAVQKWLEDLTHANTPTRFVIVDAELRAHLAQNLSAQNELLLAARAGDGPGIDRAFMVAVYALDWTDIVLPGIASSHEVSAAKYVELVRSETQTLDACGAACGFTSTATNCVKGDGLTCDQYFYQLAGAFAGYQADITRNAAPPSFAARDARVQHDLAQADAVLLTMRLAVAANDQTGFNSGITQLRRIVVLLNQDANSILQGS